MICAQKCQGQKALLLNIYRLRANCMRVTSGSRLSPGTTEVHFVDVHLWTQHFVKSFRIAQHGWVYFKWCGCKGVVESLLWCWCLREKPPGRNRKCETAEPRLTLASHRADWRRCRPCLSTAPVDGGRGGSRQGHDHFYRTGGPLAPERFLPWLEGLFCCPHSLLGTGMVPGFAAVAHFVPALGFHLSGEPCPRRAWTYPWWGGQRTFPCS